MPGMRHPRTSADSRAGRGPRSRFTAALQRGSLPAALGVSGAAQNVLAAGPFSFGEALHHENLGSLSA